MQRKMAGGMHEQRWKSLCVVVQVELYAPLIFTSPLAYTWLAADCIHTHMIFFRPSSFTMCFSFSSGSAGGFGFESKLNGHTCVHSDSTERAFVYEFPQGLPAVRDSSNKRQKSTAAMLQASQMGASCLSPTLALPPGPKQLA
jgi:hypothetical protein